MLTRYIVLIETILKFLFDHIDKSADNQARVKWRPYTVVLWDNRITAHVSSRVKRSILSDQVLDRLSCRPRSSTLRKRANVAMELASLHKPSVLSRLSRDSTSARKCATEKGKGGGTKQVEKLRVCLYSSYRHLSWFPMLPPAKITLIINLLEEFVIFPRNLSSHRPRYYF